MYLPRQLVHQQDIVDSASDHDICFLVGCVVFIDHRKCNSQLHSVSALWNMATNFDLEYSGSGSEDDLLQSSQRAVQCSGGFSSRCTGGIDGIPFTINTFLEECALKPVHPAAVQQNNYYPETKDISDM